MTELKCTKCGGETKEIGVITEVNPIKNFEMFEATKMACEECGYVMYVVMEDDSDE